MTTEAEERARVVAVAKTWLGTPYHHAARVKAAGIDCLTLLAEVYHEAAIIPYVDVPYYPGDWHLHHDVERYIGGVLTYAKEIKGPPLPGDIAVWKIGRAFSHGAIVMAWPQIIHAHARSICVMEDAFGTLWLKEIGRNRPRPVRFFSYWGQ